jgi:hypothetical protein
MPTDAAAAADGGGGGSLLMCLQNQLFKRCSPQEDGFEVSSYCAM